MTLDTNPVYGFDELCCGLSQVNRSEIFPFGGD